MKIAKERYNSNSYLEIKVINGLEKLENILTATNKSDTIAYMIGRYKEKEDLNNLYNSDRAHLVAVYGRRRVGKTYLIDQVFKGNFAFRHAGLSPVEMKGATSSSPLKEQLKHFYNSLILHGMEKGEQIIEEMILKIDNLKDGYRE